MEKASGPLHKLMENKFIHAAINYVNKGQMKVFPLQPGSKEPYPGSRGFKDASDDVMTVTKWWEERPDSNIGVATGGFFLGVRYRY